MSRRPLLLLELLLVLGLSPLQFGIAMQVDAEESGQSDQEPSVPPDAFWVHGRVLLPDGLPADEQVTVTARGRALGKGRNAPREHTVALQGDGTFDVALASNTRTGYIDIQAKYLYLAGAVSLSPKYFEGELVLEPLLGGYIQGRINPEPELEDAPTLFDDLVVELTPPRLGYVPGSKIYNPVSTRATETGLFELTAIPIGTSYNLNLVSSRYWGQTLHTEELRPGESRKMNLTMRRGARIAGRVLDDDGKSLEGARVRLDFGGGVRAYRSLRGGNGRKTNEGGEFEFAGVEPRELQLIVDMEGFVEQTHELGEITNGEVRSGIVITAIKKSQRTSWADVGDKPSSTRRTDQAISGKVVNELGESVASYELELKPGDGNDEELDWSRNDDVSVTVKDDSGAFRVTGLHRGVWRARAQFSGGVQGEWALVKLPRKTPLTLVARRATSLSGIVRSPDHKPVEGALITARSLDGRANRDGLLNGSVKSGPDGSFTLQGIPMGPLRVTAKSLGWASGAPMELDLGGGAEVAHLAIDLRPSGQVRGELHSSMAHIADRGVKLTIASPRFLSYTQTDDTGSFVFRDLPPGEVEIALLPPERGTHAFRSKPLEPDHASVVIELSEGQSESVVLGGDVKDATRVFGQVTLGGRPVAGYDVRVRGASSGGSSVTDATGFYELMVQGGGEYELLAVGSSRTVRDPSVHAIQSSAEHRIDLELPTGSVRGSVRTPSRKPAVAVMVTLRPEDPTRAAIRLTADSDEQGNFHIEHVPAGVYTLYAGGTASFDTRADGYALYRKQGLVLKEGENLTDLRIRLKHPGVVEGVVLAADGSPLQSAVLRVRDSKGKDWSPAGVAITGRNGKFILRGMPQGEIVLHVDGDDQTSGQTLVHVRSHETTIAEIRMEAR